MESQNLSNQPTESPTVSDSSDRSKFLKSLGFDRVKGEQSGPQPHADRQGGATPDDIENISAPVREAMVLSSNFEDDLELPGVTNLKEPVRSVPSGSPFADFGNPNLEDEIETSEETTESPSNLKEELENKPVDSSYEEEVSFDVAAIDDSTWAAVDHRMRPEPIDMSSSPPRKGSKKKNVPDVPVSPPVEATRPPLPPPLDDDIQPEPRAKEVEQPEEAKGPLAEEVKDYSEDQVEHAEEVSTLKGPLNLNCPACDRGLTLQPEHLGIPGNCVWCETSIIAAESGLDHSVSIFCIAVDLPVQPDAIETKEVSDEVAPAEVLPVQLEEVQPEEEIVSQDKNDSVIEEPTVPSSDVESSPWTEPTHIPNPPVGESTLPVRPTGFDSPAPPEPLPDTGMTSRENFTSPDPLPDTPSASPFSDLVEIEAGRRGRLKKDSKTGAVVDAEVVEQNKEFPPIKQETTSLPEGEIMVDPTAEASIPLAKLDSPKPEGEDRDTVGDSTFSGLPAPMPNVDDFPNAEAEVNAEEIAPPKSPFEDFAPSAPSADVPLDESTELKPKSPFEDPVAAVHEEIEETIPVSPFDNPVRNEPSGVELPSPQNAGSPPMLSAAAPPSPFDPAVNPADGLPGVPPQAPQGQMVEGKSSSLTPLPWDEVRGSAAGNQAPGENSRMIQSVGLPGADTPLPPAQPQAVAEPSRKSTTAKKPKSGRSRTAVIIAVLGLVSGAGIASFFLPVDGYIKNLKESWVEWFEQKSSVDDEWTENVIIPQQPKPAGDDSEPDPFTTHKAPGTE